MADGLITATAPKVVAESKPEVATTLSPRMVVPCVRAKRPERATHKPVQVWINDTHVFRAFCSTFVNS